MSDVDGFAPVELATIAHAVEDHAGRWYGKVGPFTFGKDDAARYVSEGTLAKLAEKHTLKEVWRAVAAHIDAHPEVLATRWTDAQIAERDAARRAAADEIDQQARAAFEAGDLDGALALIDRMEFVAPSYRDWDGLRRFVRERLATGREAQPLP